VNVDKISVLKKLFFLSLSVMVLSGIQLYAQEGIGKFNRVIIKNENPDLQVFAILRDSKGYMWFGTENGLFQFNGYEYKDFKSNDTDTTTISEDRVFDICEDKDGALWLATFSGVSKYNRVSATFNRFYVIDNPKNIMDNFILQTNIDSKGRLLAKRTMFGLYLLNPETKNFEELLINKNNPGDPTNKNVIDSYIDKSGIIWFCVNDKKTSNVLSNYNFESKHLTTYTHNSVDPSSLSSSPLRKLFKDSKGNLWIGLENGLDKLEVSTGKFTHYQHNPNNSNSIASGKIIALEEDDENLWIGTEGNGLDKLDLSTGIFMHFKSNPGDVKTLSSNTIYSLYNDKAGMLWIGTDKGLQTYTLNPRKFHNYLFASRDGSIVNSWQISDVKTGKDGALWYCTENGLYRFNRKNKPQFILPFFESEELVQDKSGKFWLGGNGGLVSFDPVTKLVERYYPPQTDIVNINVIWSIYIDDSETLWIGMGGGGLKSIDLKTKKEKNYLHNPANDNSISSNEIGAIYRNKDMLWIGPYKTGLNSINLITGKITRYNFNPLQPGSLSFPIVTAIYADKKNRIWVGTGDGLNLLAKDGKTFKRFKEKEGLANSIILDKSITEDSNGNIWVATRAGISKINPGTYAINNYDSRDGFQVNREALLRKDSKGEMVLFGINGLTVFHPEEIIDNPLPPPVSISDFQIFNKSIVPGTGSPLKSVINEAKEITLSYQQSFFTLEFAAQNYILPEKNKYAYMLEGFEKDWNYVGTRRFAYYTNVPHGKYTFKVKAANNDGIWNEQGAAVKIIITPPFWLTWWFKLLASLSILGSAIAFYKFRTKTIKTQKKKLQQQVRKQTQQLLQSTREEQKARQEAERVNIELGGKNKELEQFVYVASHDLQEPLRTTSGFIELIQQQYHGKLDEKADKYLVFISEATTRMKVLIKDLLDFSRIGTKAELKEIDCNIMLTNMLADIMAAIQEAKADIKFTELPVINGYPTEIKLLFQNLVINAIKFRRKDVTPQINISAQKKEGYWEFAVSDNGIGIEKNSSERIFDIFQRLHTRKEYEGSGIGLSHCKKIVELHGGKIRVESIPGVGSIFYFTLPAGEVGIDLSIPKNEIAKLH